MGAAACRRGKVSPGYNAREILFVELDKGQVIGLKVGDQVARLAADDDFRVDPDDIARAVQFDGARHQLGSRAPTDAIAVDLQTDIDRTADRYPRVLVCFADIHAQALAGPGEKGIG